MHIHNPRTQKAGGGSLRIGSQSGLQRDTLFQEIEEREGEREREERKDTNRKKVKISLFIDDMVLYLKYTEDSPFKLSDMIAK